MMSKSSPNSQPRIALFNGNEGVCGRLAKWGAGNIIAIGTATKTADGTIVADKNVSTNWGEYYTVKVIVNSSTVTEELYSGDTLIDSVTGTQSTLGSSNDVGIHYGYANGTVVYFKNLKVKAL